MYSIEDQRSIFLTRKKGKKKGALLFSYISVSDSRRFIHDDESDLIVFVLILIFSSFSNNSKPTKPVSKPSPRAAVLAD